MHLNVSSRQQLAIKCRLHHSMPVLLNMTGFSTLSRSSARTLKLRTHSTSSLNKNTRQIYLTLNGNIWKATANLECALRHLRRDNGKPRTLWVDALCMNQHHIPERDQQVGIMQDIYQSAERRRVDKAWRMGTIIELKATRLS